MYIYFIYLLCKSASLTRVFKVIDFLDVIFIEVPIFRSDFLDVLFFEFLIFRGDCILDVPFLEAFFLDVLFLEVIGF